MAISVGKGRSSMSEINITPLIDVVLVLLIIFMVLTPILIHEMAVNLPEKTETVEVEDLPKDQLVAAVCEDGTVALNKRKMPLDELRETARKWLRTKARKVVFVDAHPDASYDKVVELMDAVRDAGSDRVGVASLKTAGEFGACEGTAAPAGGAEGGAPAAQ